MNKTATPDMASIIASDNFISFVKQKMKEQHLTKVDIAKVAHVKRKTIYEWLEGIRSPRLDHVAQIYSALGETEICISMEVEDESIS